MNLLEARNEKGSPNAPQHFEIPNFQIPNDEFEPSYSGENACVVCFEREVRTMILDCRHSVMCIKCSRKIINSPNLRKKCPICSTELQQGIVKIYK
jgi:hypothetical protein